jgi:hypothetical protein
MNLIENINRMSEMMGVVNEQSELKKDTIKSMLKQSGVEITSRLMGGVNNIINFLYDGDIMKYGEDTHTPIVYMSTDKMNLYIHEALVNQLGLEDSRKGTHGEKELGYFSFGTKNSLGYRFTARLIPTKLHNQSYYKVVGVSGDSGFGYSFITVKNTLGIRNRQQIFQQIIDKYNLTPYMTVTTFY